MTDRNAPTIPAPDDPLTPHRTQAANRPKCCRRLANQYLELAETYYQHEERFHEAKTTALAIADIYETAGREAGTWDDEEECE